ncbi:class I SAM-dependent methyltransferase [Arthrobacter sp. SLBN-53]|uniref:class I SAM-dependent methyltransferase n=1 Tax=Arthrobacter sp. SLBN-53 TaxID=2768412 RepID=UPI00114F1A75|nr:class I SAM-dependent methyltransferase [Arthrobacter sp. SLBN-53]TQK28049.1 methyltransferase family protein [Arthrobacter sp. SLBN-53]
MSAEDRARWDAMYVEGADMPVAALPAVFGGVADLFPRTGAALDIACGTGGVAVWLAQRGLRVQAVDVSAVAIVRARRFAEQSAVPVTFDVADLDAGLPSGEPVDVLLCNKFRNTALYGSMTARLKPGGLLAICVLSEVGATPGRFRAVAGELRAAFGALDVIADGEGGGQAWLVGRR